MLGFALAATLMLSGNALAFQAPSAPAAKDAKTTVRGAAKTAEPPATVSSADSADAKALSG